MLRTQLFEIKLNLQFFYLNQNQTDLFNLNIEPQLNFKKTYKRVYFKSNNKKKNKR